MYCHHHVDDACRVWLFGSLYGCLRDSLFDFIRVLSPETPEAKDLWTAAIEKQIKHAEEAGETAGWLTKKGGSRGGLHTWRKVCDEKHE